MVRYLPPVTPPEDSMDATEPLLQSSDSSESLQTPLRSNRRILTRLYVSHFLSTWNSRMFEFGAILFLASIFQDTLLYASIYALMRSLSAVVLASWIGSRMDHSDRLVTIRHSISMYDLGEWMKIILLLLLWGSGITNGLLVWQRLSVVVSCACFLALLVPSLLGNKFFTLGLFVAVVFMACVEKLASIANTVAVERDWTIVISDSLGIQRQNLNASMRRIDLFCKLLAPLMVALFDSLSTTIAVWFVLGVNLFCVLIEYVAIAQVYKAIPELQRAQRDLAPNNDETGEDDSGHQSSMLHRATSLVHRVIAPWREYIASPIFLASWSLSLLNLTVLSFGPTMVTFLLHTEYKSLQISCMRIGSVMAELSGTWAAPFVMQKVGPIRSGLWFLNWQFTCLSAVAAVFALADTRSQLVVVSLIVGVALSRLGLWGFHLSAEFLIQEGIEEDVRGRFSSTEMAVQNIFEMLSFATTIAFPLPEQFKYPVFISYGAIAMAAICFAAYVRKERGHLLHMTSCLGGDKVYRPTQGLPGGL